MTNMRNAAAYFFATIFFFITLNGHAEVMSYRDDSGKVWYTDRVDSIPEKYRSQAQEKAREILNVSPLAVAQKQDRTLRILPPVDFSDGKTKRDVYLNIEIIGEKDFIGEVTRALERIRRAAPEEFIEIRKYIKVIRQGDRTMTWPEVAPGVMTISRQNAFHTDTFTAGIIAHESYHYRLYTEGKVCNPNDYESIKQEELKCIQYEIIVLRKIGARPSEINLAISQDGTHFDVNKDGKYDMSDFAAMDW
jgi:hypothetical protein